MKIYDRKIQSLDPFYEKTYYFYPSVERFMLKQSEFVAKKHVDMDLITELLYFDKTQNISEENLLYPLRTIPISAFHIQCCSDHLKAIHDVTFVMI